MELKDLLSLQILLTLLCPGIVFVFVHTVARTGRPPSITKDNLAAFVAVSTLFTVAATAASLLPKPLTIKDAPLAQAPPMERLEVVLFAFVCPAILGGVYAAAQQRDFLYRMMLWCKLSPVNPSPSAWETCVKRLVVGDFVIATLKDGKTVAGNLDAGASFSSEEGCFDMLLSETNAPPGQNAGVIRSTWIASGEVQTLEIVSRRMIGTVPASEPRLFFRPAVLKGDTDEQKRDRFGDAETSV